MASANGDGEARFDENMTTSSPGCGDAVFFSAARISSRFADSADRLTLEAAVAGVGDEGADEFADLGMMLSDDGLFLSIGVA